MNRNTATRDRHRKIIARTRPNCWLCGQPINWDAKYPDPRSFVVDHVVPLSKGGSDTLDNKRAACAGCNNKKRARIESPIIRRSRSLL